MQALSLGVPTNANSVATPKQAHATGCHDERHKYLPDDVTDESLLASIGLGQQDALAKLFERHGRAVYNVSLRILRDQSEADDLRQDVFLYVYKHAHVYDPTKSSASSWIIQITYHRAINRRHYLAIRQHYMAQPLDDERYTPNAQPALTDRLDGRSLLTKLGGQLTLAQHRVLLLYLFEGYSFREISDLTDESLGNIRNHYYRGIERLRSLVFKTKSSQ